MRKTLLKALLGGSIFAASAFAGTAHAVDINGTEVSVGIGADYVSQYVFRGISFADDSLQPYVEAGIGNFTLGLWANAPLGDNADDGTDEIDLYASYGFGLADGVSASVGITYYHFPETGDFFETDGGTAGTYEVNAGVSFDETLLSPFATAYYDFTLESFTLEGGIGYGLDTGERSQLNAGLTAGFVETDGGTDYEYATLGAGYSFSLTDDAALTASVNYTINSESQLNFEDIIRADRLADAQLLWFGIGLSAGF